MRVYWATWGVLLGFTVLMLWLDGAPLPRTAFMVVMIGAMLAKATIIGANFMHLRRERRSLAVMVVVGLIVTAAVLFALIAPDAARVHQMIEAEAPAGAVPQ